MCFTQNITSFKLLHLIEKLIKQTQFHPGYFSPPIKQTVIFGQIQINFII